MDTADTQRRFVEVRDVLTMIGALHRGWLPTGRAELDAVERVWHMILEEIPTGHIFPMAKLVIKETAFPPKPHDLLSRWRSKAMPQLDPDAAAEIVREGALAASYLATEEKQRGDMAERIRWLVGRSQVPQADVESMALVAWDLRDLIRRATPDQRPIVNAAIRRSLDATHTRHIAAAQASGGKLAPQIGMLVGRLTQEFSSG